MNRLFRWQIVFIIAALIDFFWAFVMVKQNQELSPVVITSGIATGAVAIEFAIFHAFGLISEKNIAAKTSAVAAMVALSSVTIISGAKVYGGNIATIIAGAVLLIAVPVCTFALIESTAKQIGLSKKLTFRLILNEMGVIVMMSNLTVMFSTIIIK